MEISESFNKADGPLGPDLTWADVEPGWAVVSNRARPDSFAYARAEHDLSSVDHYAEATATAHSGGFGDQLGVCARCQAGSPDQYAFVVRPSGGSRVGWIEKTVGGSGFGPITSEVAFPNTPPFVIRIEAEGSTIRGYVNGVLLVSGVDTDLTSGVRAGIFGTRGLGAAEIDNFSAGALVPPGPVVEGFHVGTLAGPARVAAPTPTGPALRRTLTGPALARTVTGPEI